MVHGGWVERKSPRPVQNVIKEHNLGADTKNVLGCKKKKNSGFGGFNQHFKKKSPIPRTLTSNCSLHESAATLKSHLHPVPTGAREKKKE